MKGVARKREEREREEMKTVREAGRELTHLEPRPPMDRITEVVDVDNPYNDTDHRYHLQGGQLITERWGTFLSHSPFPQIHTHTHTHFKHSP